MAELHVWQNGDCVWVVAESARDAAIVWGDFVGYDDPVAEIGKPGTDVVPEDWHMVADELLLTVCDDLGDDPVTKTCGEWVLEDGRGFLCTTEG